MIFKAGLSFIGLAIFFAGAAFQESIAGTAIDHPDGGAGSLRAALWFLFVAFVQFRACQKAQVRS